MTNTERFLFDLQGYLVVDNVLTASACETARRLLDTAKSLADQTPDGVAANGRWHMAFGLLELGEPFRKLIDHPAVTAVLQDIIAPQLRLEHAYSFVYSQGAPPLQLHAGDPDEWLTYHYHVHRGRIRTGMCVVSYVLQDIRETSGGFVCIPGSHKSNFDLTEDERAELLTLDNPLVRPVAAPAGSAIIFTETLIHGARSWQEPESRYGLFYKYNDRGAQHMHPRNSPATPAVLDHLTPEQQSFFKEPWRTGGPDTAPSPSQMPETSAIPISSKSSDRTRRQLFGDCVTLSQSGD